MKLYLIIFLNIFSLNYVVSQELRGIYQTSVNGQAISYFEDSLKTEKIDTCVLVKYSDFESVSKVGGNYGPVLQIKFTQKGKEDVYMASKSNLNKKLVLIIDNNIVTAPIVNAIISEGKINFSMVNEALMDKLCMLFMYEQSLKSIKYNFFYNLIDTTDFTVYNYIAPNKSGISIKYYNKWKKDSTFNEILNCTDNLKISVFALQGTMSGNIKEMIENDIRFFDKIGKIVTPLIIDSKEAKMTFTEQRIRMENLSWRNYNYYIENDGIVYKISIRVNKGNDYGHNFQVMNYIINSIKFLKN